MKPPTNYDPTSPEWKHYWRWTFIEGWVKIGAIMTCIALAVWWLIH